MRAFQSGAIVTFGNPIALVGVLELLIPSWIDSAQSDVMEITILLGVCSWFNHHGMSDEARSVSRLALFRLRNKHIAAASPAF